MDGPILNAFPPLSHICRVKKKSSHEQTGRAASHTQGKLPLHSLAARETSLYMHKETKLEGLQLLERRKRNGK